MKRRITALLLLIVVYVHPAFGQLMPKSASYAFSHDTTFQLPVGGELDATNTVGRKLDYQFGLYRYYALGFEPLQSVTLTNNGVSTVNGIALAFNAQSQWQTLGSMVSNLITPSDTGKRWALKLWKFVSDNHAYFYSPEPFGSQEIQDPVKFMTSYGYGDCFMIANLVKYLNTTYTHDSLWIWGLNGGNHAATEVRVDNKCALLDADEGGFYLHLDNQTLASYDDIRYDPYLYLRTQHFGPAAPYSSPLNYYGIQNYLATDNYRSLFWEFGNSGIDAHFSLMPGESFSYVWPDTSVLAPFHQLVTAGYAADPTLGDVGTVIKEGVFVYKPAFLTAPAAQLLYQYSNITVDPGYGASVPVVHPVTSTGGSMMIRMSGPFVMTGGQLVGSFYTSTPSDQVTVSYSPDLVNWTQVWQSSGQTGHYTTTISLDAAIGPLVNPGTYGYYLLFQFQPATTVTGCGVDSLAITDSCQVSRFFAPSLIVGNNNIAIQTGDAVQSGRSLQLAMQWQENSGNTPPTAVAGPVFPLNGSSVDSTQFTFSWPAATDPDGDSIVDYHFELSDDSTMSVPLATNFDRYLSGIGTPVTAQFRPERPDFLNDGKTYYWRVRPLDSRGAWGAWSPVWRFTPHGPRQPLNFRYVLVDAAHVQLEWSPNPQGNPAVNYVIYTDSVRGFFPTPALVQATLADTSFVLPISNFRYVRIGAVDANGVASAPSPYITIWPPVNATYGISCSSILPTQSNNGYALKFIPQDTSTISGSLAPKRTGVLYLDAVFINDLDSVIATEVVPVVVSKAPLQVQATDTVKPYGSALFNLPYKVIGFLNGDTSLTTPPSLSTTATASSAVGAYPVSILGAIDTNYTITYLPGILTVIPDTLTIAASSVQSSYGGAIPGLTVSYTGFVNGDSVSSLVTAPAVATPATSGTPVGNYPIIANGASDSNYTFVYVPGVLTILPDTLTITVLNDSMVYGGTMAAPSFSFNGFVLGDNPSSLTTNPVVTSPATSASGVGTYPLNASGAADSNYFMVYVSGLLTITPAPLIITPNNAQMAYGSPVPSLTATYTGFVNGDSTANLTQAPVLVTTATPSSDVDTYPITAGGALDSNYMITYGQPGILTVDADTLIITANNQVMTYGDSVPVLSVTYSGFENGDDSSVINELPTLQTTVTSGSPVGVYPITLNGGSDNDYILVLQNGVLTVDSATLFVQGPNDTVAYDETLPPLTYTVTGWKNQDSSFSSLPQITTSAAQGSPAGWYPVLISGGAAPNYSIVAENGSVLINATRPKLSFDVQGSFPDSSYTYTLIIDTSGGTPDYTVIELNDITSPGMSQNVVITDTPAQARPQFSPARRTPLALTPQPGSVPSVYSGILSNIIAGHDYRVFAIISNTVGADTSQTFNIFTQVNSPFVISPNPAATSMNINVGVAWEGITKVRIYSLGGAEVYQNDNMNGSGLTVDVRGLSTGTYIVVLFRQGRSYSQKVMIVH